MRALNKFEAERRRELSSMSINYECYFRLNSPKRDQYKTEFSCLDDRLPKNHKARLVWAFVESMDITECFKDIYNKSSRKGGISSHQAGRPITHPRCLLALWLYAIIDGVISGRELFELTECHDAYRWLRGDVPLNRTTINDFRSDNPEKFKHLLTSCLAVLRSQDLLTDEEMAQDGTRVKASAGFNSYRRKQTIEEYQKQAMEYLTTLEEEQKKNPGAYKKRAEAAELRIAQERKDRLDQAIKELEKCNKIKTENATKNHKKKPSEQELKETRASTTDPEARKMKMGDGGYRLAYNVQLATGTSTRFIYGVDVVNILDPGNVVNMMTQVAERMNQFGLPSVKRWLADAAYSGKDDVERVAKEFPSCSYYTPAQVNKGQDPKKNRKGDSEPVKNWRETLGSEEMTKAYKNRCSTAEFSNAQLKNHGMRELLVRGLEKAAGMACLFAIAQNIMRAWNITGNMT